MNASEPAARPAHPFLEFTVRPSDMILSRLVFLDGGHPADPLIARKGRKVLPDGQCCSIGRESLS